MVQLPLPLVGTPLDFCEQGFVLDGNGPLLGGLGSLSNGPAVWVGN